LVAVVLRMPVRLMFATEVNPDGVGIRYPHSGAVLLAYEMVRRLRAVFHMWT